MAKEYSRTERVDAQLQRELAELIQRELSDPRVEGVTVTQVSVSPDLRHARVRVSLLGSDADLEQAITALRRAASRLRRLLGQRLRLRRTPELQFLPDNALREGDRIAGLIRSAVNADLQAHAGEGNKTTDDPPA